jgi:hypothetical protein
VIQIDLNENAKIQVVYRQLESTLDCFISITKHQRYSKQDSYHQNITALPLKSYKHQSAISILSRSRINKPQPIFQARVALQTITSVISTSGIIKVALMSHVIHVDPHNPRPSRIPAVFRYSKYGVLCCAV